MDIEKLKGARHTAGYTTVSKLTEMDWTELREISKELIDEAIARQSVTSEEVQEAIGFIQGGYGDVWQWSKERRNTIITALQEYQPWIPVSERLPDDDTRVLTLMNNGIYEVQRFNNGLWWDSYGEWEKNVTHWKPLPEPPRGE